MKKLLFMKMSNYKKKQSTTVDSNKKDMLMTYKNTHIPLYRRIAAVVLVGFLFGLWAVPLRGQNSRQHKEEVASAKTILEQIYNADITHRVRESSVLNKVIAVDLTEVSVLEALKTIAGKADLTLSYDTQLAVLGKQLSYHKGQVSIQDALWMILRDTQLGFAVSTDGQLILMKKTEQPSLDLAQETITGSVTDAQTGETLPGVNILVKGTSTGASTNAQGEYELTVESLQDTLVVSFVGYQTMEVPIEGRTEINVALQPQAIAGEELVVVGYGTVEKSDLTGSVTRIKPETFKNQSMTQLTDMLAGTVAGFAVNQASGPAGGSSSLEIRGTNSITAGTDPMIVLDGAVYDGSLRDINPNDIETIDILKDASSAAVYGARAASGVILITTTRGTEGKPTINFSSRIGLAQPTNDRRPLGPQEYIQFRTDWFRTVFPDREFNYFTNPQELPEDISIEEWRNLGDAPLEDNTREYLSRLKFFPVEAENYINGNTTDWYDVVMRNAMRQKYDLSLSGGTDNTTYYWSIGYNDNEGLRVGDKFSALRSRLNIEYQVNDWLNIGLNGQYSNRDEGGIPGSLSFYSNSPFGQMYTDEGFVKRLPHGHTNNPLLEHYLGTRDRRVSSFFANTFANVSFGHGFEYELSFQPRYGFTRDFQFRSTNPRFGGDPDQDQSQASRDRLSRYEWIVDNILKWKKDIGIHSLDVTLLYSIEQDRTWSEHMANLNFTPKEILGFHGIQFGDNPSINSNDTKVTGDAMMARINYTLLDKYLFTASVRRDGYSAFGQEEPRAIFPAAAFAWQISDEDFFDSDLINNLKLRLSWGLNGNRDIGAYSSLGSLSSNIWYDGSSTFVGVSSSRLSNPNLAWEKTESLNIGFDIGLIENRIGITLDAYTSTTTDLLLDRRLPSLTGYNNVTANLGELRNRGIELTLNTTNISSPKVTWNSQLVFSTNRNEIRALYGDKGEYTLQGVSRSGELPDYVNQWFPGKALDVVWDYDELEIWQVDEETEAENYGLRPGDFKVEDLNNDGVYIAEDDKQFIGYENPRYNIGLLNQVNFLNNWSASVFVRADLGHIGALPGALNPGEESNDRRSRNVGPIPYWTPQNPINDYARLDNRLGPFGGGLMKYVPRSFVRIQNVSLSYNLPPDIAGKVRLHNVRIFGSAQNIATFTKWPQWDPETGYSPMSKTFTIGINLSL